MPYLCMLFHYSFYLSAISDCSDQICMYIMASRKCHTLGNVDKGCHFSFYVWEIMHSTVKKMNKQVQKLQKEVDEARDRREAAHRWVNR